MWLLLVDQPTQGDADHRPTASGDHRGQTAANARQHQKADGGKTWGWKKLGLKPGNPRKERISGHFWVVLDLFYLLIAVTELVLDGLFAGQE